MLGVVCTSKRSGGLVWFLLRSHPIWEGDTEIGMPYRSLQPLLKRHHPRHIEQRKCASDTSVRVLSSGLTNPCAVKSCKCLSNRKRRGPLHLLGSKTIARAFDNEEMSNLSVTLKVPNGRQYIQPTGLFINNEFVTAKSNKTITSIDPA